MTFDSDSVFPCIAWDNLLFRDDATITASSAQAGFPAANACNWNAYTWWKPNDGVSTLEVDLPEAQDANCIAIYAHNLGVNRGWAKVQYSLDAGSTWLDASDPFAPGDTEVIYKRYPTVNAARFRLYVNSTPASIMGCVFIGKDLQLERGCKMGFGPPAVNRATKIINNITQGGIFVGRSVIYQGSMVSLMPDFLTEGFIYEQWKPFLEHAEQLPWFLLWSPSDFPNQAAWCFSDPAIAGSTYTKTTLMNAQIKASCRLK